MVSVARRNLFQDKTRLIISVGGVAFALLLVLALDAIFAGAMNRITAYIDNSNAEVWVAQEGVRNMHMATSSLPLSLAADVERVQGVADVAPILYATNIIDVDGKKGLAYIIGITPGEKAGRPWKMASGTPEVGSGEVIIDKVVADKLGVDIGDKVEVIGAEFTVKALSKETSNIASSIAFVSFDEFARIRRSSGVASYLLVSVEKGASPGQVAERIQREVKGVTATVTPGFSNEERRVVRDMSAELLAMMNFIGFLIGIAVTGLTIYTATLSKLKEYGIVKAIGAKNRWLYGVVLQQAFMAVFLGLAVAVALNFAMVYVVSLVAPDIFMDVDLASIGKVLLVATAIGGLASVVPIRKIAALDPARVFRG